MTDYPTNENALIGKNVRLIVVSNREPYIHKRTGNRVNVEKPAGGLTSALDDVLQASGGTWVAWGSGNADRDFVDQRSRISVPPDRQSYTLRRVWLSQQEVDNYYYGYANQVLWPLSHITLDRVFYRKNFWEHYARANRVFADAVIDEAVGGDLVWIHDYHLCLVPRMLRERAPALTIAYFWHIPWPDWSVFRACPQSREILEGLLANDLIGFQVPLFARNFMDCVRESLDADIDYRRRTVTYGGRTTRFSAFPISVDFEKFETMAAAPRTARFVQTLRARHHLRDVRVGIGVDRLEYTKGLLKRLQAIELFFERYAKFRQRFTFIQIAVPTRMREPYLSYGKTVEGMIERINRRFSQEAWKPIIYINTKVEHEDLAAYYRMADVAVISSVYDGMNLVAKEYIASQIDENGALILSEFAGAAEELDGALLVNPYDLEEFSDRIRLALLMPREEQRARMNSLRRQVREHTIHDWVRAFLSAALSLHAVRSAACRYLFDCIPEFMGRIKGRDPFLFLDFDGTLAPIVDHPDRAAMPEEVRAAMMKTARNVAVAVVSGRALSDLWTKVRIGGIVYAGNHGAEIWDGTELIRSGDATGASGKMKDLMDELGRRLSGITGVLIEDKGITSSVHFRQIDPQREGEFFQQFWDAVRDYEHLFRVTSGKRVLEIRPREAWNKGDAVESIMQKIGGDTIPVYVGDDTTDEDAYRAIKGTGISISIGENAEADYFLKDQDEIGRFLSHCSEWFKGTRGESFSGKDIHDDAHGPGPITA